MTLPHASGQQEKVGEFNPLKLIGFSHETSDTAEMRC